MRKWNKIVVEEDWGVTEVFGGTRALPGLNVYQSDEDVEATRQGYRCIQCFENFESAWPESCPVCTFPVKEHQAEHFAFIYKGWQPSRTGADFEREADRISERAERRAWQERAKKSGLILAKRFF